MEENKSMCLCLTSIWTLILTEEKLNKKFKYLSIYIHIQIHPDSITEILKSIIHILISEHKK